jgi:hypothetical protein
MAPIPKCRKDEYPDESHKLVSGGATPPPATISQRYTVKEAGEPVELARYPLAQCDSETLHHFFNYPRSSMTRALHF